MSCFVVSDAHINALITYAALHPQSKVQVPNQPELNDLTGAQWGQWMRDENERAYRHRYGHRTDLGEPLPYHHQWDTHTYTPVEIIKLATSFRYQLAEAEDWAETPAAKLAECIIDIAITELPGYEQAPWEV